jgi:hypothetical protein
VQEFDFRRFLNDCFRTPATLQALVKAYGYNPPNLSTTEKWWSRASIPAKVFPMLLIVASLEVGPTFNLVKYMETRK